MLYCFSIRVSLVINCYSWIHVIFFITSDIFSDPSSLPQLLILTSSPQFHFFAITNYHKWCLNFYYDYRQPCITVIALMTITSNTFFSLLSLLLMILLVFLLLPCTSLTHYRRPHLRMGSACTSRGRRQDRAAPARPRLQRDGRLHTGVLHR